jgi:hypothetical protein
MVWDDSSVMKWPYCADILHICNELSLKLRVFQHAEHVQGLQELLQL